MNTATLAAIVAAVGFASWAGSLVFRWWDLLTAWLIWGCVVLAALLHELTRHRRDRRSLLLARVATSLTAGVQEHPSH